MPKPVTPRLHNPIDHRFAINTSSSFFQLKQSRQIPIKVVDHKSNEMTSKGSSISLVCDYRKEVK
jgi:hypothetical protein